MHYPYGRIFMAEEPLSEGERLLERDISVTGLIPGTKAKRATAAAALLESPYDEAIAQQGTRRYAWVFPTEITRRYVAEKAHYELGFVLPKGAYATTVVDLLRGYRE